jgi:hypothetical protein
MLPGHIGYGRGPSAHDLCTRAWTGGDRAEAHQNGHLPFPPSPPAQPANPAWRLSKLQSEPVALLGPFSDGDEPSARIGGMRAGRGG